MDEIKGIGKFLGGIVVLLMVLGIAKSCGRSVGKSIGQAALGSRSVNANSSWSPEVLEQWRASGAKVLPGISPEEQRAIGDCFVAKITTAAPDTRAAQRLGQTRMEELGRQYGIECGKEARRRIMATAAWTADARKLIEVACIHSEGERMRSVCACLSRETPKLFASPAQYLETDDAILAKSASAKDTATVKRLVQLCADDFPGEP